MPDEPAQQRFSQGTWHHTDFDADDLLARRKAAGLSVSVVVPARNEEGRVGRVVATLHRQLVDGVPLIDELLVVDGDSTDATAAEAAACGATVVRQSAVLAGQGPGTGKGEALWKGLYASSGDLVVFVDADIHDVDERFVVGLLGPLLHDPECRFVKATYDRPLELGGRLRPAEGGRVTELLARPLLAAFWPELSWLAQPLSGEYAGTRAVLEQLPFVQGYGVELALLIDLAARFGTEVVAQVDLGQRVHDHQPLAALSRMAAEILAVATDRLEREGRAHFEVDRSRLLPQPTRDGAGELGLRVARVSLAERPPLATLDDR